MIQVDVSVIIVHYRACCFLEQCIRSVQQALKGMEAEIWVVDNHSNDGSREYIEPKFSHVQFRWLDKNLGFSAANNLALQQSSGRYVLFLNPDTILPEHFFLSTLHWFQQHPSAGALGVRMIDGSGTFLAESKRGMPTIARSFWKMTGLTRLFPRSRALAGYYAGHLSAYESHPVEVLAGACLMMTRQAATATAGFDERFFMYAEDIDLSVRVRQAGWENHYLADPAIIHFKGESTRKLTLSYIRNFYGSMSLFVDKHYADKSWLRITMKGTIFLAGCLAAVGMFVRALLPGGDFFSGRKALNTLVVASQEGFNEVIKLSAFAARPMRICGRVSPSDNDKAYTLGPVSMIGNLIREQQVRAVIFCLGDLSAGDAISIVQEYKNKCRFYFHYQGTRSMVGSHNRNNQGDQIRALA